jgi:hypothetical protein
LYSITLDPYATVHDCHECPEPPPLLPEVLLGARPTGQPNLDLASEGVQRYIWQSAYGAMLIEVRDGIAFVNGARVARWLNCAPPRREPRPTVARRC